MKIEYKIIYNNSDGDEYVTRIDLNNEIEDVTSDLYSVWTDYKDPDYSEELHKIRFARNKTFTDLDVSDFQKIGEMLKSRADYEQVKAHCQSEFSETVHGKEFLKVVFDIEE